MLYIQPYKSASSSPSESSICNLFLHNGVEAYSGKGMDTPELVVTASAWKLKE